LGISDVIGVLHNHLDNKDKWKGTMENSKYASLLLAIVVFLICAMSGCATPTNNFQETSMFTASDREAITGFFSEFAPPPTPGPGSDRTKPAQLKDEVDLQRGTYKKLARGAGSPLPPSLERKLAPLQRGCARLMVGWSVVVVKVDSGLVVDRVHARGY
jgi:hypothetical protein